ncbi:MAG TPA: nucleotide sugar dehydrogenase, partial [Azospirillaceae bacterium]|nr:nucleotide sugar dehydrogenase [Azospirillaceae bacterium]
YPGTTEEYCVPVMERASGLAFNRDFFAGYSPERINPGDKEHRLTNIVKVTSGSTREAADFVDALYASVIPAGTHKASSIKVAEAAKVIENTQRDLNIALMNELAIICHRLGIDTQDVLAAAGTKWNFLKFVPGLVGGHCIGVDPYYLTHRAEQIGYHPQVILAGRRTNDAMGQYIARETVKHILRRTADRSGLRVTVLGLTFKENVPDVRNTKVIDIVREIESFGIPVSVHDPVADASEIEREYGLCLTPLDRLPPADAVVLAVAHDVYRGAGWPRVAALLKGGRGLVTDVKGCLERGAVPPGVQLWRL